MAYEDGEVLHQQGDRYRLRLVPHLYPENPRTAFDHLAHVVTVPHPNYLNVGPDEGPLGDAWRRIIGERHRVHGAAERDAVEIFERYARIFHGARTLYDSPYEGPSAVWYILPDGIAQLAAPSAEHPDPAMACLQVERDEYRAWAEGDVWGYIIEVRETWVPVSQLGAPESERDTMQTWEEVPDGSCWGFYGYSYAEQEATEAWEDFLRSAPQR